MRVVNILFVVAFVAIIIHITGCGSLMTRTEIETYTIVVRDTINRIEQKNVPGQRDNGIVYPSSKVIESTREITTRDSFVVRDYPNFIRLGVFESNGLIGTSKENQLGAGIFREIENYPDGERGYKNKLFSGGYYRFGIAEWRLRWFQDAKNWTFGTSLAEFLAKDNLQENLLFAIFPFYVKKRFFLWDKIPYISISPSFGFGFYPSQYINFNTALEIGSLGGLNFRLYGGIAFGQNPKFSPLIKRLKNVRTVSVKVPYVGVGISFLDFVNIVPELYTEWKDHPHSSWNIGLIQYSLLNTNSDTSISETTDSFFKGFQLRLAPTSVSIPILNNQFYIGTALVNAIFFGFKDFAISILPFRLGYWQMVIPDELSFEPFIEYGYYPSEFVNAGGRLNLRVSDNLNLSISMGYVSGSNKRIVDASSNQDWFDYTPYLNFSRYYIGVGIGILDRIFLPKEIRYNKKDWK
ncbi:MAG: hypothetical protein ACUVQ1_05380 [Candidatus Kapaibacteriales bacterium]